MALATRLSRSSWHTFARSADTYPSTILTGSCSASAVPTVAGTAAMYDVKAQFIGLIRGFVDLGVGFGVYGLGFQGLLNRAWWFKVLGFRV